MSQDRRKILFVGGIPATLTESQIQSHFAQFCSVAKVRIMKEKKTHEPKGFAFVTLESPDDVQQVLEKQHVIQGRKVDVQLASRKGEKKDWKEEQKNKRIFVSNLPTGISNDELALYFTKYSEVRNAYIIRDFATDQTKNYGYVEFKEKGVTDRILADTVVIGGCTITCLPYVGRHEPKSKNTTKSTKDTDKMSTEFFFTKKETSKCSPVLSKINEAEPTDSSPTNNAAKNEKPRSKYEYIGMSPMLNQEESNYSFNYTSGNCRLAMLSFEPQRRSQIKIDKSHGISAQGSLALYRKMKNLKLRNSCQVQGTSNSVPVFKAAAPNTFSQMSKAANTLPRQVDQAYCCFKF